MASVFSSCSFLESRAIRSNNKIECSPVSSSSGLGQGAQVRRLPADVALQTRMANTICAGETWSVVDPGSRVHACSVHVCRSFMAHWLPRRKAYRDEAPVDLVCAGAGRMRQSDAFFGLRQRLRNQQARRLGSLSSDSSQRHPSSSVSTAVLGTTQTSIARRRTQFRSRSHGSPSQGCRAQLFVRCSQGRRHHPQRSRRRKRSWRRRR